MKPVELKTLKGFEYYDYNEIIMFKAKGHYSLCYIVGNENPHTVFFSITFIERKYCNGVFFRCCRSCIVNLNHVIDLELKSHTITLTNNIKVKISGVYWNAYRQLYININNIKDFKNYGKQPLKIQKQRIGLLNLCLQIFRTIKNKGIKGFRDYFVSLAFMILILILFCGCEGKDKFLRPDLPEKLCCIVIIDADDTSNYSRSVLHYFNLRNSFRYISLEKSYQSEYNEELNDSLKDLSLCISSSNNELFNFTRIDKIKNLYYMELPDSIDFITGEKYILKVKEKNSESISAEVIVPESPPVLNCISTEKNTYNRSKDFKCSFQYWGDNYYSADVKVSFKKHPYLRQYYGMIIDAKGAFSPLIPSVPYHGPTDFIIKESNTPGFFSEIQGINMIHYYCTGDDPMGLVEKELAYAFFIDSKQVSGNECFITVSIPFRDAHAPISTLNKLRIKLISITEEFYLFEKSLNTYKKVKNDPFSEPVYINGNIKGGNGMFTIFRSTSIEIYPKWF